MKARLFFAALLLFTGMNLNAQITAPEPVGGQEITEDYITRTLVYPEADLEKGNSGKVIVGMHIDPQGNASNYTIKSSFSETASPIALHLVKTILWKPATNIGIPMDYDYEYVVSFNARSYKRYWKRHERPVVPLTLEADTSYRVYEYRQLEEVAKPYFSDGSSMGKYIVDNMVFPAEAKEREIQGTVRLSFVVETDGNVSNIVVINSVGGGCDNEAVRLLESTIWIPAEKNGKYVRSSNMQDFTFSIGAHNFQDGNNY